MRPRKINAPRSGSTVEGAARAFALLLAALCASVTAAAQTAEFVELASYNAAGTAAGNNYSFRPQLSADGRFLLFESDASNIVPNDTNGARDIFVRDLETDTTRLVSVNASGTGPGNHFSMEASITPDGRFVLFRSSSNNLVAGDANNRYDIFVRDLQLNTTTLVSVNSAGTGTANGDSLWGFITPDGRYAVFTSTATDIVPGINSRWGDVFRRDLHTGTTVCVSMNAAGTGGGSGPSSARGITPDGRYVLFESSAPDIVANDMNGFRYDVFRRDLQTGTTALASVNNTGTGTGDKDSRNATMSDDGRVVVFESESHNLVPGPMTAKDFTSPSIFARDFGTGTTTLVSEQQVFEGTMPTVPPAKSPRVSADGRYVFYLRFENSIAGLNRPVFRDRVFRRDLQTGDLLELPFFATGLCDQGFDCRSIVSTFVTSADGRYVAYGQQDQPRSNTPPYSTSIIIHDLVGGGAEVVTGLPGIAFTTSDLQRILTPGSIVAGGKLAFSSGVAHSPDDNNTSEDVYLFAPPSQNRLAFNRSSYTVSEDGRGGSQLGVRVRRVGYLADSTVTVRFETSDGTALAGVDYAPRSETLTFAPGDTEKSVPIQVFNEEEIEPTPETLNLTLGDPTGNAVLGAPTAATLTIIDDDPHFFQFSAERYDVSELTGGVTVTVTVTGTPTRTISVGYSTSDGTAVERSDYITARGRLTFAPGETSKTFRLLVVDDVFVEPDETVNLSIFEPKGTNSVLGTTRATSQVRITSNDSATPASNPIDASDFFVRQHYYDFLNREPDAAGLAHWTNEIESCGADAQCREVKRVNVSAAFFLSIEFQTTGYLAYLTNKTAFGSRPLYANFMHDVQTLQRGFVFGQPGAAALLEANKRAYFDDFVTRGAFTARYAGISNEDYVRLLLNDNGLARTVGNVFVSRLDAAQVGPATGSGATGVVILRRPPSGAGPTATVSLSLQNLSGPPTAVHLHGPAARGESGAAIATLPAGEFADLQLTLTDEQVNWLNTGQLYVDVHTQGFPEGEIRAQLGPTLFRSDVLVSALNNQILTRAQVLRVVAEFDELRAAEFNRAFVLMEYFGYLRREPDVAGYNFWLEKLNSFGGDYVRAEMVKAFINSTEYRRRFGP